MTRRMAPRSTSESMIFYSMVAMTLVAAGGTSDGLSIISRGDWILLIVAAFATLAALYLQVEGFRYAEASTVAPFKYSNLVWAALLDVMIWQHFPTWNVLAGAAVLAVAMFYIFSRERTRSQPEALRSSSDLPPANLP